MMFMFVLVSLLLDLRDIGIVVMLMRRDQNGRHQMHNTLLDRHIGDRNGRVFVDCHQSQTMEIADVDGNGFLVEVGRDVKLYHH